MLLTIKSVLRFIIWGSLSVNFIDLLTWYTNSSIMLYLSIALLIRYLIILIEVPSYLWCSSCIFLFLMAFDLLRIKIFFSIFIENRGFQCILFLRLCQLFIPIDHIASFVKIKCFSYFRAILEHWLLCCRFEIKNVLHLR